MAFYITQTYLFSFILVVQSWYACISPVRQDIGMMTDIGEKDPEEYDIFHTNPDGIA
jgi:hypothetical protein